MVSFDGWSASKVDDVTA